MSLSDSTYFLFPQKKRFALLMATRRKYERVIKESEKPAENTIRVTTRTMATNFVRRAIWLF